MNLSPIILFVFNRPDHTRRVIEALEKNDLASESDLFIYSDAPKKQPDEVKVREVRDYISGVTGFKKVTVITRDKNFGLANNIIDGVSTVVSEYGKVIVLEDDLVTSPYFLKYMNEALDKYEKAETVVCIHGYMKPVDVKLPDTFFLKGADCWGWATWKRGWEIYERDGRKLLKALLINNLTREFDYDGAYPFTQMLSDQIKGKNNSWAIRWQASAFIKNKLTLYPGKSLVQNIGNDGSGVHSDVSNLFDVKLSDSPVIITDIPIRENTYCRSALADFYNSIKPPLLTRVYRHIKLIAKNVIYGTNIRNV